MAVDLTHCTLCPRECGADRTQKQGRCGAGMLPRLTGMPAQPVVARAMLHQWEEPCISGSESERGSGTVFFSGCPLGCRFCQNAPISLENFGREVTVSRLGEIFLELQEQGAWNLNLVSAAQYLPQVVEALDLVRGRLGFTIPAGTRRWNPCASWKGMWISTFRT